MKNKNYVATCFPYRRQPNLPFFKIYSFSAIRVTWQITIENQAYVEGFFIRFRDMSGGSQKFNMKTVMNSESDGAASHIITGLRKYTEYEVFLMPFYKMMEGQPSNSLPRGSRGSILQIHLIISGCFANFQLRYFFTQFATKNIEKVSLRTEHTRPCLYFCKLKSRQFIPNGERLWHVPAFQPFESVTTL